MGRVINTGYMVALRAVPHLTVMPRDNILVGWGIFSSKKSYFPF